MVASQAKASSKTKLCLFDQNPLDVAVFQCRLFQLFPSLSPLLSDMWSQISHPALEKLKRLWAMCPSLWVTGRMLENPWCCKRGGPNEADTIILERVPSGSHSLLCAVVVGLMFCLAFPAVAQRATANVYYPPSSIERPQDVGKFAHTNYVLYSPNGSKPVGAPAPPAGVETHSSLQCLLEFISSPSGQPFLSCNISLLGTRHGVGGWGIGSPIGYSGH